MTRVSIHFPNGEKVVVSSTFANGMCDVFKESNTLYAGALDYSRHAALLKRLANVFSDNMKSTHVRVISKLVTISASDLIAILEFSNYFGHEYLVHTVATVIAKRLPRMSHHDILGTFGAVDTSTQEKSGPDAPLRHIIRHVPPLTW